MLLNDITINVRVKELKNYLQQLHRNESTLDHIGLVARYNLYKKVYDKTLSLEKADELEFQIQLISGQKTFYKPIGVEKYPLLSKPVIACINGIRWVMGKPSIGSLQSNTLESVELDLAYYYERNNFFKLAILSYNKALSMGVFDKSMEASVKLHQGYCYALLGEFSKAEQLLNEIIENYKTESVAITATILLRYIKGFHSEQLLILKTHVDSIEKSEKLYSLLAYEQSLDVLDKIEYKVPARQLARIRYYKGRCYSSLGNPAKAVDIYLNLITSNPKSPYAVLSNRQMYVIGSRIHNGKKLKKMSIDLNKVIKDRVLNEMMNMEAEDKKETPVFVTGEKGIEVPERLVKRVTELTTEEKSINYVGKYVVIKTADASTFKGTVLKMTGKYVVLDTSIGRINVKRQTILSIAVQ